MDNAFPSTDARSPADDKSGGSSIGSHVLSSPALLGTTGSQRVLIVENDTFIAMGLRAQLERLGHVVVGVAATKEEAAEYFREFRPELVLLDIRLTAGRRGMNDVGGLELAEAFGRERPVPMIVLSAFSDPELINRAGAADVFGYLIKPVNLEMLQAQIEVAVRRFREREALRREKDRLAETLEARKLVERAKGIFMKRLHLDEPEAHRRLQQESQKRRMNVAEVARKVIESEELLGG